MASPTFSLKAFFQCTLQDTAKEKKNRPASCVPSCQVFLCVIHHSSPAFLPSPTYTSPLCSTCRLILLSPLLETTQASSFSKSPLNLTNFRKAFVLNCSRRILGEKRNKESIRWRVYWVKGWKWQWRLGNSRLGCILIDLYAQHRPQSCHSFLQRTISSFLSNMWFVQKM